ncbi:MAG: hypothetical protein AB7I27_12780 [Bacteriovoracaceae bacterium]
MSFTSANLNFFILFFVSVTMLYSKILLAEDCIDCKNSGKISAIPDEIKLIEDLSAPLRQSRNIDYDFISRVQGKAFNYLRPVVSDGEPNCVAATLRAGNYLPAFAISGTDSIYEGVLPYCFSKQKENSQQNGDIGIFYLKKNDFNTLAHMFLFLDDKNVFEKPSPNNKDLFRRNTVDELRKKNESAEITLEIWRYTPKKNCPLLAINKEFHSLPESSVLKRVSREIEERISSGDWESPAKSFTKAELHEFQKMHDKKMEKWFSKLPGGYRPERDYPKLLELQFAIDVIKTAQRIPITK